MAFRTLGAGRLGRGFAHNSVGGIVPKPGMGKVQKDHPADHIDRHVHDALNRHPDNGIGPSLVRVGVPGIWNGLIVCAALARGVEPSPKQT